MRPFNTFTSSEKQILIEKLTATDNMEEFLEILKKEFDMKNCKPGTITKKILSTNMVNVVLAMINPKQQYEK